ncbi:MAG: hypothetical protein KDA33_11540 [Phycisphaerales bacterium]|nr:hypothetical protein [Phycisphaerales bacterium]
MSICEATPNHDDVPPLDVARRAPRRDIFERLSKGATMTTRDATRTRTHREADLAEEIRRRSPDGRPAQPESGPTQIGGTLLAVALLIIVLAGILSFAGSPILGIGAGVLALLFFVTNPVAWAAFPRAGERAAVGQRSSDDATRH